MKRPSDRATNKTVPNASVRCHGVLHEKNGYGGLTRNFLPEKVFVDLCS